MDEETTGSGSYGYGVDDMPDFQSRSDPEPINRQTIVLKGNNDEFTFEVSAQEVTIVTKGALQELPSNKVKVQTFVKHDRPVKTPWGPLIASHRGGDFFAYAIFQHAKPGMVRIFNHATGERALVKGFDGEVIDIAFAYTKNVVLAACDTVGTVLVYGVDTNPTDQKLTTTCLMHLVYADSITSERRRLSWCPYVPDATARDCVSEDGEEKPVSYHLLLAISCEEKAFLADTNLIAKDFSPDTPIHYTQIVLGGKEISAHDDNIVGTAIAPDASAVAIASMDGMVTFSNFYLLAPEPTELLHRWTPHDGKRISSLFFLDNFDVLTKTDTTFWKYAITGAEDNREIKLWACTKWKCIQTIKFEAPSGTPSKPVLVAEMDTTRQYLVVSDAARKAIYVLQLNIDDYEVGVYFESVCEFLLVHPLVSYSIESATVGRLKNLTETGSEGGQDGGGSDGEEDGDGENSEKAPIGVTMLIRAIQPKAVNSLQLRYVPECSSATSLTPESMSRLMESAELQHDSYVDDSLAQFRGQDGMAGSQTDGVDEVAPRGSMSDSTEEDRSPLQSTQTLYKTPTVIGVGGDKVTEHYTEEDDYEDDEESDEDDDYLKLNPDTVLLTPESFSRAPAPSAADLSSGLDPSYIPRPLTSDMPTGSQTGTHSQRRRSIEEESLASSHALTEVTALGFSPLKGAAAVETRDSSNSHHGSSSAQLAQAAPGLSPLTVDDSSVLAFEAGTASSFSSLKTVTPGASTARSLSSSVGADPDVLGSSGGAGADSAQAKGNFEDLLSKMGIHSSDSLAKPADILLPGASLQWKSADGMLSDTTELKTASQQQQQTIEELLAHAQRTSSENMDSAVEGDVETIDTLGELPMIPTGIIPPADSMRDEDRTYVNDRMNVEQSLLMVDMMEIVRGGLQSQAEQMTSIRLELAQLRSSQSQSDGPVGSADTAAAVQELTVEVKALRSKVDSLAAKQGKQHHTPPPKVNFNEASMVNKICTKVSEDLRADCEKIIGKSIGAAVKKTLVPGVDKMLSEVTKDLQTMVAERLTATDAVVKSSIGSLLNNKRFYEAIAAQVTSPIATVVKKSFSDTMTTLLMPSFQQGLQALFSQVNTTFREGVSDYMKQTAKEMEMIRMRQGNVTEVFRTQCTELSKQFKTTTEGSVARLVSTLKVQAEKLEGTVSSLPASVVSEVERTVRREVSQSLATAPSVTEARDQAISDILQTLSASVAALDMRVATLMGEGVQAQSQGYARSVASTTHESDYEMFKADIRRMIECGQFTEAVSRALSALNLKRVMFVLKSMQPEDLFSGGPDGTCLLDQSAILSLIQQLSQSLEGKDVEIKHDYLQGAVMVLNVRDASISKHAPRILESLCDGLRKFVANQRTPTPIRKKMNLVLLAATSLSTV